MNPDRLSIPRLGSLVVPFPAGWTFEFQDQTPIEGRGPNGAFATISFSEALPNANAECLRGAFEQSLAFVNEMLMAVAIERGTPYKDPFVLLEEGGRTLHAAGSKTDGDGVKGYFLQYLYVSSISQHYFNVGGQGDIDEAMATWNDIMCRARWVLKA